MRRREFITLLGGAAAAWPFVARAQQDERARQIGVLMGSEPTDPQMQARIGAMSHELRRLGWIEGQNLKLEVAWDGGHLERATNNAKAFVDSSVDVIVANGTLGIEAARKATDRIPTIFALVGNPVGHGIIESLAHPGGNVTGFSAFEPNIVGKWIQTLKEIALAIKQVTVLSYPDYEFFWRAAETAAPALGVKVAQAECHSAGEIERSISAIASGPDGALMVLPAPFYASHRDVIIRTTAADRVPAVYPFRYYAKAGGLIAYGIDAVDIYRRTAGYVDRILKGEKPADLPVQAPTKYALTINLKTAKALGLTVPQALLVRADEVIE